MDHDLSRTCHFAVIEEVTADTVCGTFIFASFERVLDVLCSHLSSTTETAAASSNAVSPDAKSTDQTLASGIAVGSSDGEAVKGGTLVVSMPSSPLTLSFFTNDPPDPGTGEIKPAVALEDPGKKERRTSDRSYRLR